MVNAYHKSSGMNFGALMLSQGLFMTRNPAFIAAFFAAMIITACFTAKGAGPAKLQVTGFGKSKEGHAVYRYILSNKMGLVSLPDRSGRIADIVLGYDDVNRYEQDKSYFGTTIRRYGNRIAGGQFTLDGIGFHLPKNDGPNSLHAGIQSFNKRLWMGVDRSNEDAQVLELSSVGQVNRAEFRISQDDERLKFGKGYDHHWALARTEKAGWQAAAEVFEPTSGRVLEVLTTEPGIQFYSGKVLDGTARDKGGQVSGHRTGFCMETQHFPDSQNHRNFPSAELRCSNLSVNDSLQA
ncbi:MAG: hypothetical protein DMG51_03315 [Acidobacteria bacterium]|nr:MAG: hypothetical protein DMG51_03315 [Acidobacteriota bacterium]